MTTQFKIITIALATVAVPASGLLTGCATTESWPPRAGWVTDVFHDNREAFTELENRLLESKYSEVRLMAGTGAYGQYVVDDAIMEEKIGADGRKWAELFVSTRMTLVFLADYGTYFSTGLNPFVSAAEPEHTVIGSLSVVHSESLLTTLDLCDDSHRLLPHGHCYLPLDDGWGALYKWTTM